MSFVQVTLDDTNIDKVKADSILLPVFTSKDAGQIDITQLGSEYNALCNQAIENTKGFLKGGKVSIVHLESGHRFKSIVLLSVLASEVSSTEQLTDLILNAAQQVTSRLDIKSLAWCMDARLGNAYWQARYIIQSISDQYYKFNLSSLQDSDFNIFEDSFKLKLKLIPPSNSDLDNDLLSLETAVKDANALQKGKVVARCLADAPSNICTPEYVAQYAHKAFSSYDAVSVETLNEEELSKLGFNALLAVNAGSKLPANMTIIHYNGDKDDKTAQNPIVLVGKGVTFDSGGISLKPGSKMDEMKFDMCGAASVLGTMIAAAECSLPTSVIALLPLVENMPGQNAVKPGDVITSLLGKTIEILNTDAEGRLILCDSLAYAHRFNPSLMIDVATLTGACIVALGHEVSGMVSNNDALAASIQDSGDEIYDSVWRLPLGKHYTKQLDSNFADLANIGGRSAGTITAGAFLQEFVAEYPWAHLDIAGTAWKSGKQKGATGRPVPLLFQFLLNRARSH